MLANDRNYHAALSGVSVFLDADIAPLDRRVRVAVFRQPGPER